MFGYVKPFKPMLRMCEFDTYRAVYCGLCKQLSRAYGPFARMTLNYDFAFLALLGMALREEKPQFARRNCLYNPLKKRACCLADGALRYSADAAMLMLYYKVMDNIADEKFPRSLLYRAALPTARRARDRARLSLAETDAFIAARMKDQAQLEQNKCGSVDRASEPTALCLSHLLEGLSAEEDQRRVLGRLGYLLGRWVYMADALDDIGKDRERGRYNPFVQRAGEGGDMRELVRSAVLSLNLTIGEIMKTYGLLRVRRYGGILENVVDLGLKNTVREILARQTPGGEWAADLDTEGETK